MGVAPAPLLYRIAVGVFVPLGCGLFLLIVLAKMSSEDVRSDPELVGQYCALGLAWIGLSERVFAFLGVSLRDDVIERRNAAASFVIAGELVAVTCCFAGANIGNGPGVEVVLFSAMVSTLALVLLWLLFDRIAQMGDNLTVERDAFAGVRVAGWLIGTGIVLGAGVAGDWHSAYRTLLEFGAYAWPAVALTGGAALLERRLRNDFEVWAYKIPFSVAVGIAYVTVSVLYVFARGLY
jgi:uncharacterized membrane protein YjfL (UPF0719 family)